MKLKIVCNWASGEEVTRRLIEQFNTKDNDISNIEFVYDNSYDGIVYLGHITEQAINNKPSLLFPQEPTWTGGHQKSFNGINNIKIFGFDKHKYYQPDVIIETIAHMFYGSTGPWQEGWDFWNYENVYYNPFIKTKNLCAFVSTRGINEENFPEGCLYRDRVNLINGIFKDTPFIDFYGWTHLEGDNMKYFALKKSDAIKDYKFCLTVENSNENYYISEKFYDCILTNTIPIYFGCKNIDDFWTEGGYILLDNITDHKYVIDKLKWVNDNCDELYEKMLPEVLKMKERYFNDFNLLKKIKSEFI